MEHLERFLRNTLVKTENDKDRIHSNELGEAVRRHLGDWTNSSVVDSFNRIHPDVPGSKQIGHKPRYPRIVYHKLRWINEEEKWARAQVLICVATPFEGATLRSLLNFVSTFEAIPDFDIQRVDVGFCVFEQLYIIKTIIGLDTFLFCQASLSNFIS